MPHETIIPYARWDYRIVRWQGGDHTLEAAYYDSNDNVMSIGGPTLGTDEGNFRDALTDDLIAMLAGTRRPVLVFNPADHTFTEEKI